MNFPYKLTSSAREKSREPSLLPVFLLILVCVVIVLVGLGARSSGVVK